MRLLITDNDTKKEYLKQKKSSLHDYKFMSKDEFFSSLLYNYDYKTVVYIMEKYNKNINITINILKCMYVIDVNKKYKSKKLEELRLIKQDLIKNNLLIFDNYFKDYLLRFDNISIKNIMLEKYEKEQLDKLNVNYTQDKEYLKNIPIYKYETLEDEIFGTIMLIRYLIDNGVDINKIYLTNISDSDLFLIERSFNLFDIPISLNKKISIYNIKDVKDFVKTNDLSLITNKNILNKVISVLNTIENIKDSIYYKDILKYLLSHTYLDNIVYKNSIRIKDINTSFSDDDFVFCISFNNDVIPKYIRDDSILNDNIKDEISLYKTHEKNTIIRENIVKKLKSINNLYLSYHLYNEKEMSISNISTELLLEEKEPIINYNISDKYNRLKLSEYLDEYNNYNVKNKDLDLLYENYDNIYNSYDNSFLKIDKKDYIDYLKKPLTLSFSSLDNYNLCGFKYYINNVLKIDKYEETFNIFIGNLFHYILSLKDEDNFSFDRKWNSYLDTKNLSNKEKVLLKFIKEDFKNIVDRINEMMEDSLFKKTYSEILIEERFDKEIEIIFKGIVDKIITYDNISDTYFAVIDYKTYDKKFDINNIVYGIDMQLPIYTYLIGKSNLLKNPIFAGMYFEKVINSKRGETETVKLTGFSTDNLNVLEKLDSNYRKSNMIKGLSFSDNNGFGPYSKILSEDEEFKLIRFVKDKIEDTIDNILEAKFDINPKRIDNENISCKYCKYRDLCFVKEKNIINLDKKDIKEYLYNN